jgi:hypothetical protein
MEQGATTCQNRIGVALSPWIDRVPRSLMFVLSSQVTPTFVDRFKLSTLFFPPVSPGWSEPCAVALKAANQSYPKMDRMRSVDCSAQGSLANTSTRQSTQSLGNSPDSVPKQTLECGPSIPWGNTTLVNRFPRTSSGHLHAASPIQLAEDASGLPLCSLSAGLSLPPRPPPPTSQPAPKL